jgi:hypothetical protein
MAKAQYDAVVKFVASYIGDAKAGGLVERQLKHCAPATPDTFTKDDLQKITAVLTVAASLYITDDAKKAEFKAKLPTAL